MEQFLEEALGFRIEGGNLKAEGVSHRSATIAELTMWELLRRPQSEWHDIMPLSLAEAGTLS